MVKRRRKRKSNGRLFLLLIIIIPVVLLFFVFVFIQRNKDTTVARNDFPKIAIVLDDWGYTNRSLKLLEKIDYPLTLAVLPNLKYSQEISLLAADNKREVILHLPMEPFSNGSIGLEPDTITSAMSSNKIKQIFLSDLKNVSTAKGVSNHMGSKATQDKRVMKILLRELKRKKLYFLDSYVTSGSVAEDIAIRIDTKHIKRDVFLDNERESGYIINQLVELARIAKEEGFAVGIGHEIAVTLRVLKDYIPKFEKEGFEFVLLSDLLR